MALAKLAILILMILSFQVAQSATLIVICGNNASFNSIQSAIDAAKPGDTIEVSGGTYLENVYIYKTIRIQGVSNDSSMPIIDAGDKGSAITLAADGIHLEGLMMTNSMNGSGIEIASSNNTLIGNKAINNKFGIYVYNSRNNTIANNELMHNHYAGIELDDSDHNLISNNNVSNSSYVTSENSKEIGSGIVFYNASNNELRNNTLENNTLDGISIYESKGNIIRNNSLSRNIDGIYVLNSNETQIDGNHIFKNRKTGMFIESSNNCNISKNTIQNHAITGFNMWKCQNNILRDNLISENKWNFDSDGLNDIDTSNLLDGRPIYYLVGKSNIILDEKSQAGAVYCINCNNIIIKNLEFKNNDMGVLFDNTTNSLIANNRFEENEGGIVLQRSNCNYITNNEVNDSLENGILVSYSSDHNNVLKNAVSHSLKSGLVVVESWSNVLTNNIVNNNKDHGISINNSGMNSIKWNEGSHNGDYGLFITTPNQDNEIDSNSLSSNMNDTRVLLEYSGICSRELDFGDTPDSFHTLLATNGARHQIVYGIHLGQLIDAEPDGIPTQRADGDDKNNLADEDGVTFAANLSQGSTATVYINASIPGKLNAWVDFNGDGDFYEDAKEQIFDDEDLAEGLNTLDFDVPSDASVGPAYSRFRFNIEGGLSFEGLANNGEVEDYLIWIVASTQG